MTGSVSDAAGSGMVPSFRRWVRVSYRYGSPQGQRQTGTPRWGMRSVQARMLTDAEQAGRHRNDSGRAAWIRYQQSQAMHGIASVMSADGQVDRADVHELLRQPREGGRRRRLMSGA